MAGAEAAQAVAVIVNRAEDRHPVAVGERGRVDKGVDAVLPGAEHTDAGLDGAPAFRLVAAQSGRALGLRDPGQNHVGEGLGVFFIARRAVGGAEVEKLGMARELPGPFLVPVEGRVDLPVDLPFFKLIGRPSRRTSG